MESFRDKNEGAYRSAEAGTGELLGDPGSELRVGREKEKEKSEDTMDKHKKKIRQGLTYSGILRARLGSGFFIKNY